MAIGSREDQMYDDDMDSDNQDEDEYDDDDDDDDDDSQAAGLGLMGGQYNVRVTDIIVSEDESSFMPDKD